MIMREEREEKGKRGRMEEGIEGRKRGREAAIHVVEALSTHA